MYDAVNVITMDRNPLTKNFHKDCCLCNFHNKERKISDTRSLSLKSICIICFRTPVQMNHTQSYYLMLNGLNSKSICYKIEIAIIQVVLCYTICIWHSMRWNIFGSRVMWQNGSPSSSLLRRSTPAYCLVYAIVHRYTIAHTQ